MGEANCEEFDEWIPLPLGEILKTSGENLFLLERERERAWETENILIMFVVSS